MSPLPLVTIVTATRDRPDVLRRALASIRSQTFEQYEAIVVDDGSRPEVRAEYEDIWRSLDQRFLLVCENPSGGPGSGSGVSRNRGLELARGDWVAFLDHDDFWLRPDHLTVGVAALADADGDYFFANVRGDRDGPVEVPWAAPYSAFGQADRLQGRSDVFDVSLALFLKVMRQGLVHPSQTIARRSLLQAIGGFPRDLRAVLDLNLMFRLADRAQRILYRSTVAVGMGLSDTNSFTAAVGRPGSGLNIHAYQALMHARLQCARHDVQACIRSRQAWVLREFAQDRFRRGQPWEALRLSCEAVAVAPTPGAAWAMLSIAARAFSGPRLPELPPGGL